MRVDHNDSSIDARPSPSNVRHRRPRFCAAVACNGGPRRVRVGLIAGLEIAKVFDSTGRSEGLEMIGKRTDTPQAARMRPRAAYRGGSRDEVIR